MPRVEAYGLFPLVGHLEFALSSEVTNFLREVGPTGVRADISPELRWSARGQGYFFEPVVGYRYTQYDLQNAAVGDPSTPTRTLPYTSLDTGLIFERDSGSQGQRTETLEPRLMYSYVPYRNQNELPIFDTGLPDMNLVELFRTNRYVGDDRIGDANQLAMGLTTRLFSASTGAQYLSATLGQIRYFSIPRVFLPDQITQTLPGQTLITIPGQPGQVILPYQNLPTLPGQTLGSVPGQTYQPYRASDVVAEVAVSAYKNWSVNLDYQWNPYTSQTDKSEGPGSIPPGPEQGGERRLSLPRGHSEAVRRVFRLADRQPLEHRRSICLLHPGPPGDRAARRRGIQELLLAHPGVAEALLDQPDRGTGHLDCITIGTDRLELGRKTVGRVPVEGDQRLLVP